MSSLDQTRFIKTLAQMMAIIGTTYQELAGEISSIEKVEIGEKEQSTLQEELSQLRKLLHRESTLAFQLGMQQMGSIDLWSLIFHRSKLRCIKM